MAKTTISLDQPTRPKGDLIEVPPFGLIENGSSITVEGLSDEEVAWVATGYGVKVKHGGKNVDAAELDTSPDEMIFSRGGEE